MIFFCISGLLNPNITPDCYILNCYRDIVNNYQSIINNYLQKGCQIRVLRKKLPLETHFLKPK